MVCETVRVYDLLIGRIHLPKPSFSVHTVKVRTKPMTLLGIIFVKGSLDDK
jgi:hypothetical protein